MPNFEVFTKKLIPLGKEPTVTIQRRGNLTLNTSAFAAMGSPKAVTLMYDRDACIIGLQPAERDDPNAYPPRPAQGRPTGPYVVTAAAFMTYFGIDVTPRRFKAIFEDGVLCIDLKNPIWTSGSQNGRARRNGTAGSG